MRRIESRLTFTLLLTVGCDLPGSATCDVTDPGGQAVTNTAFGAWPAELAWREVWRAGGLTEAEGLLRPADVAVSPDGLVAIADWGLAEVILLGPGGEWQGAVMTRGDGPGEVQAPAAVTWVDANTLLVLDLGVRHWPHGRGRCWVSVQRPGSSPTRTDVTNWRLSTGVVGASFGFAIPGRRSRSRLSSAERMPMKKCRMRGGTRSANSVSRQTRPSSRESS